MNLSDYNTVIAIDPDLDASGVVIYNSVTNVAKVTTMPLWELYDFLHQNNKALILLENGDLVKGNWHGKHSAKNVGKGHGVSISISKFLKTFGFEVIELKPQGFSKFKTNADFVKATGLELKSSNNEERSALCILLKYFKVKKIEKF